MKRIVEKIDYRLLGKKDNFLNKESSFTLDNSGKTLIKVKNLTKKYSNIPVVNKINLVIKKGDAIALMGANGAGKTTLVEMICDLVKPTSGKIVYDLGKGNFKRKIGIQFQENIYPPGIKVKDLVDFYKDVYKKVDTKIDMEALINKFDIRKLYKTDITRLSGGELQRVNILLAIINNPKVVFFDEISTGLDIQAKLRIIELIKELRNKYNWTVVVITHNVEDVSALCNRVVVMSKGSKVYDESLQTIYEKYGSLESFISEEVKTTLVEQQTIVKELKSKRKCKFSFKKNKI